MAGSFKWPGHGHVTHWQVAAATRLLMSCTDRRRAVTVTVALAVTHPGAGPGPGPGRPGGPKCFVTVPTSHRDGIATVTVTWTPNSTNHGIMIGGRGRRGRRQGRPHLPATVTEFISNFT